MVATVAFANAGGTALEVLIGICDRVQFHWC
jgi:hypothetical protein